MSTVSPPPPDAAQPVPPTAPGAPERPTGSAAPRSAAPRVVATVVGAFGALVILGSLGSAAVGTAAAAVSGGGSSDGGSTTVDTTGVTEIDTEVGAGSLRIEFADVDQATLDVTGAWGADQWTLEREEDTIRVSSPDRWWGGWMFGDRSEAVLTLPDALEGIDADLTTNAGDLRVVDGDFGELDLELGAGSIDITGSARSLDATVSAGQADLELSDVAEADVSVSAGDMDLVLTGSQPSGMTFDVSAGRVTATVPEGEYDITSEVSAGDFDSGIGSTPGARSTVEVSVTAGQVELRAG
ncbi:DUF4097 family beta strand repeat-containing protein [Microbacterium invictum]|uniref:DUF4097 family beta strand repeat-containing protein n=1 Tax=Microbacterium invictum TaxID=515415 RepID=A0ABZ0VE24_9MICO|nr:DUF4097 family beta strand repeat-containing protein [Microbacterium invictum]WQB70921.1 DUF4097 family beta strand repeat-containing protein [Microbacterium invictum]